MVTKTQKIYTLKLARRLCDQGFQIINVSPNPQKPWLNMYEFEATPEFMEVFNSIMEGQR